VLFSLLVLGTLVSALLFAVSLAGAFGPLHNGTTRADMLIGAMVFALVGVVAAWLARVVEHNALVLETGSAGLPTVA